MSLYNEQNYTMNALSANERLIQLELESVDELIGLVERAAADVIHSLSRETDDGFDDYADEAIEVDALAQQFGQLSAVALFSVVEIRAKSCLRTIVGKSALKSAFKWAELQKQFQSATGKSMTALPGYDAVDELRCINNCFKHSGTVNNELSKHNGWTEDDPLGDVRPAVQRIRPDVSRFLQGIVQTIRAKTT